MMERLRIDALGAKGDGVARAGSEPVFMLTEELGLA